MAINLMDALDEVDDDAFIAEAKGRTGGTRQASGELSPLQLFQRECFQDYLDVEDRIRIKYSTIYANAAAKIDVSKNTVWLPLAMDKDRVFTYETKATQKQADDLGVNKGDIINRTVSYSDTFAQQINLSIDDCAVEVLQDGAQIRLRYAKTDADRQWFTKREENRIEAGKAAMYGKLAKQADAAGFSRMTGTGEGFQKLHKGDAFAVETNKHYAERYQLELDRQDPITATESPSINAIDQAASKVA